MSLRPAPGHSSSSWRTRWRHAVLPTCRLRLTKRTERFALRRPARLAASRRARRRATMSVVDGDCRFLPMPVMMAARPEVPADGVGEWQEAAIITGMGATRDDCACPTVRFGWTDSGSNNWNPDCPVHGLSSLWWNSDEQKRQRDQESKRVRHIQAQAALARRLARDGVTATERRCRSTASHDLHYWQGGNLAWHRCPGEPCDHSRLCCALHDHHVLPHRGCLLR